MKPALVSCSVLLTLKKDGRFEHSEVMRYCSEICPGIAQIATVCGYPSAN